MKKDMVFLAVLLQLAHLIIEQEIIVSNNNKVDVDKITKLVKKVFNKNKLYRNRLDYLDYLDWVIRDNENLSVVIPHYTHMNILKDKQLLKQLMMNLP